MNDKTTLLSAAVLLFSGVVFGALGAHGLQSTLEETGHLKAWETAVFQQVVHGLALLATGVWKSVGGAAVPQRTLSLATVLWIAGVVLFSGSLYVLGLGGPRWLGPITPVGGLCLLSGWLAFASGVILMDRSRPR